MKLVVTVKLSSLFKKICVLFRFSLIMVCMAVGSTISMSDIDSAFLHKITIENEMLGFVFSRYELLHPDSISDVKSQVFCKVRLSLVQFTTHCISSVTSLSSKTNTRISSNWIAQERENRRTLSSLPRLLNSPQIRQPSPRFQQDLRTFFNFVKNGFCSSSFDEETEMLIENVCGRQEKHILGANGQSVE